MCLIVLTRTSMVMSLSRIVYDSHTETQTPTEVLPELPLTASQEQCELPQLVWSSSARGCTFPCPYWVQNRVPLHLEGFPSHSLGSPKWLPLGECFLQDPPSGAPHLPWQDSSSQGHQEHFLRLSLRSLLARQDSPQFQSRIGGLTASDPNLCKSCHSPLCR